MPQIPGIYVPIRGDYTKFKADLANVSRVAKEGGTEISNALNNSIAPSTASNAIANLTKNLAMASRASQSAGADFKSLTVNLGELGKVAGVSEQTMARLQARVLETANAKTAERAWASLQRQLGASNLEMAAMRASMGDVGGAASSLGSIFRSTFGGLGPLLIAALSVGAVVAFGKEVVATGLKVDALNRSFGHIAGGADAGRSMLLQLRAIAGELGQEFYSSADAFKGFAAATKNTSLEGQGALQVYRSLAEASSVLGLTQEQSGNALRALGQMMSKGTVQAEELRGQLGEALPGAFQMAARAMGVTEQQLNKMLEQGQVLAADLIPKLAAAMHDQFGEAAKTAGNEAQASINRATTAWEDLKASFYNSDAVKHGADIVTAALEGVTNAATNSSVAVRKYLAELAKLPEAEQKAKIAKDKMALRAEWFPEHNAETVFGAEMELERQRIAARDAARRRHGGQMDLVDVAKTKADFKVASDYLEAAESESARKRLDISKDYYEAVSKAAEKYRADPEKFAAAEAAAHKMAMDRRNTLDEQESKKATAGAARAGREQAQARTEAYRATMEADKAKLATLEGEEYWAARRQLIEREYAYEIAARKKSGESAVQAEAERNAKLASLDQERLREIEEWWDNTLEAQEKAHKAEIDAWLEANEKRLALGRDVEDAWLDLRKKNGEEWFSLEKGNLDNWLHEVVSAYEGTALAAEMSAKARRVYDEAIKEAFIEGARAGDDFFTGMAAGFAELEDSATTWGERGADAVRDMARIGENALSDLFMGAKGGWSNLMEGMKRMFADAMASMAMQGVVMPVIRPVLMGLAGGGAMGMVPGLGGSAGAYAQGAGTGTGGGGFGMPGLSNVTSFLPSSWTEGIGSFMSTPLWGSSWAGEAAFAPLAETFGVSAGPSLGGLLGAGGLASLGYGMLGSFLPGVFRQNAATPFTSGLGGAGGFALGNMLLPGLGGIIGAILGGMGGGLLGGLFGGKKKDKIKDVYAYTKFGDNADKDYGVESSSRSWLYDYKTILDIGEGNKDSMTEAEMDDLANQITAGMDEWFKALDDTFHISVRKVIASKAAGSASADKINRLLKDGASVEDILRSLQEGFADSYLVALKEAIAGGDRGWITTLMQAEFDAATTGGKLDSWIKDAEKLTEKVVEFRDWIGSWTDRMGGGPGGVSIEDFIAQGASKRIAGDSSIIASVPGLADAMGKAEAAIFMDKYGDIFKRDTGIDTLRRQAEEQFDSTIQALETAGADQKAIDALTDARDGFIQAIVDQVKAEYQEGLEINRLKRTGYQDEAALMEYENQQLQTRIATAQQFGENSQEYADLLAEQAADLADFQAEQKRQRDNYNAGLDMRAAAANRTPGFGEANALAGFQLQQADELHQAMDRYGQDSAEVARLQAIHNQELENFKEAQERAHAATLRTLEVRRLSALGLSQEAEMIQFRAALEEELYQARVRGAGADEIAAIRAAHAAEAFAFLSKRMDEAADRAVSLQQRMAALTGGTQDDLDASLAAFDLAAQRQIREAMRNGDDLALLDKVLFGERAKLIKDFHQRQKDEERRYQEEVEAIRKRAGEEWTSFATNIRSYLEGLQVREAPHSSPESRLAAAREQFAKYYDLAAGGDRDAMGRITQLADTLLQTGQDYYGSTSGYQAIYGEVTRMLEALPEQISVEELMLAELGKIAKSTEDTADNTGADGSFLAGLGGWITILGTSVDTLLDKWDANADKQMTKEEFLTGLQSMSAADLAAFQALFGAAAIGMSPEAFFAYLDADKNGIISAVELNKAAIDGTTAAVSATDSVNSYQAKNWKELNGINLYLGGNPDSLVNTMNKVAWQGDTILAKGLRETIKALHGVPSFGSGGDYGGGLARVHADELLVNMRGPTRILTAADSARMLDMPSLGLVPVRGGDDGKEVLRELQTTNRLLTERLQRSAREQAALRDKVDELTVQVGAMARAQEKFAEKARANKGA